MGWDPGRWPYSWNPFLVEWRARFTSSPGVAGSDSPGSLADRFEPRDGGVDLELRTRDATVWLVLTLGGLYRPGTAQRPRHGRWPRGSSVRASARRGSPRCEARDETQAATTAAQPEDDWAAAQIWYEHQQGRVSTSRRMPCGWRGGTNAARATCSPW
jgi:hypothetical protein